ncbi:MULTISPECIES: dethiobiotin synthase [unclassified Brevundimonas]|uniref:dethiobiotin synthase n=1 Tax=unclassified Brevundimonas TaxID=2622653 RepID=UPI0025C3B7D4|nr:MULTISPECIES: dethiobiotin synthase [unclassified Brevundimonas]
MSTVIVTGTDTGIGKTVFSAGLTRALGATYWKPVQSGLEEATDSETVACLSGCPVLPEAYRLQMPASPHLSAEAEGVEIDIARLTPPPVEGPLVIEGAGGLMAPLTRQHLFLDVIAGWKAPVVLVARTSLGTINHSLLSLTALRARGCTVAGVAFVGEEMADSRRTIAEMGQARDLGRLPFLADLTPDALTAAFEAIDVAAIRETL